MITPTTFLASANVRSMWTAVSAVVSVLGESHDSIRIRARAKAACSCISYLSNVMPTPVASYAPSEKHIFEATAEVAHSTSPPAVDHVVQHGSRRKRRLSADDSLPVAKRPRCIMPLPQRHSVSNPLPLRTNTFEEHTESIDDWASGFTIVEPATYAPPNTDVPEELDFTGWSRSITGTEEELAVPGLLGMCVVSCVGHAG